MLNDTGKKKIIHQHENYKGGQLCPLIGGGKGMTVTNNNEKNALAQEQAKHLMMSEILERYYHTGKHNKVCCPFHEEKTPSFAY